MKTMVTTAIIITRGILTDTIKFELCAHPSIVSKITELKIVKGLSQSVFNNKLTKIAVFTVITIVTSTIITTRGVLTNAMVTVTVGTVGTLINVCENVLTHSCLVDVSILIKWTSLVYVFHFLIEIVRKQCRP